MSSKKYLSVTTRAVYRLTFYQGNNLQQRDQLCLDREAQSKGSKAEFSEGYILQWMKSREYL